MSWLLLVLGVLFAALTWNVFRPLRWPAPAAFGSFFAGWVIGELAPFHAAIQGVIVGVLVGLGGLAAWPGFVGLGLTVASVAGLVAATRQASEAGPVLDAALAAAFPGGAAEGGAASWLSRARPFSPHHPDVVRVRNVGYTLSDHPRHTLDVFHRRERPAGAPVFLYVHGGGWVISRNDHQGLPLLNHVAAHGWVGVSANYRLSPGATFPDHIIDVKRAITWVREHIAPFGGDPSFIAICGGSAGGHLAALAALTPGAAEYQPGFEGADTTLQACIPIYGIYDLMDRHGHWPHGGLRGLLERVVFKARVARAEALFRAASPVERIHAAAPPFFVIHGDRDSLVPVREARRFVERFRAVAAAPCAYAEIPGAQHAFEIFVGQRTPQTVEGILAFLEATRHGARPVASATAGDAD